MIIGITALAMLKFITKCLFILRFRTYLTDILLELNLENGNTIWTKSRNGSCKKKITRPYWSMPGLEVSK